MKERQKNHQGQGVAGGEVGHDRSEETPQAKARWFASLSMNERMEMLVAFTELALATRPELLDKPVAEPTAKHIQAGSIMRRERYRATG